jgi:hypothetical protein
LETANRHAKPVQTAYEATPAGTSKKKTLTQGGSFY